MSRAGLDKLAGKMFFETTLPKAPKYCYNLFTPGA